ncbi:MAG: hypothetical protein LBR37_00475 [Erysipelotrichaceae bacterium]|jgi:hypothetical protein|nr:hypothetical protein [Erysipelotrichaceae bacterium]
MEATGKESLLTTRSTYGNANLYQTGMVFSGFYPGTVASFNDGSLIGYRISIGTITSTTAVVSITRV